MSQLRADFSFGVQALLVERTLLDAAIHLRFKEHGVGVVLPRDSELHWERRGVLLGAIGTTGTCVALRSFQILVYGEEEVLSLSETVDKEAEVKRQDQLLAFGRRVLPLAQTIADRVFEWARVNGQPWLGVQGEHPTRVSEIEVNDLTNGGLIGFNEALELPGTWSNDTRNYPCEKAFGKSALESLARSLESGDLAISTAESMLADALHVAWAKPPDLRRAILMAAIACELKVKETMRTKVERSRLPLVTLILQRPGNTISLFNEAMEAAVGRSLKKENQVLQKQIKRLFEARNGVAHKGEKPCEEEAKALVTSAEQAFVWLNGL